MSRSNHRRAQTDVTDAELGVLHALWDHGASTVRQLTDALYPGGGSAEYGTVQKLLQRLQAKRCVARVRGASPLEFTAAVERTELVGLRLQRVVDQLCAGSWAPIVSHLADNKRLSAAERDELREFLAKLDKKSRRTS